MPEATAEFEDLDEKRRGPDAGEVFMLTFATVGALALLDADVANAALPDASSPLSQEDAQRPAAADVSDALGPPAAADRAFLAAIAALSPPSADEFDAFAKSLAPDALAAPAEQGPTAPSSNDPAAPGASADARVADDNILAPMVANDTLTTYAGSSAAPQSAGVALATGPTLSTTGALLQFQTISLAENPASPVAAQSDVAAALGLSPHTQVRASSAASQTVTVAGATPNYVADIVAWLDASALLASGGGANLVTDEVLQALGAFHVGTNGGGDLKRAY